MIRLDEKGYKQAEIMKNKGDKTAKEMFDKKDEDGKLTYKIVKKHGKADVVDLYDTVILDYGDGEEETVVLTGNYMPTAINEITLNSPVGSAIYEKPKGAEVVCTINGIDHNIVIKDFTKPANVTEAAPVDEKTTDLK